MASKNFCSFRLSHAWTDRHFILLLLFCCTLISGNFACSMLWAAEAAQGSQEGRRPQALFLPVEIEAEAAPTHLSEGLASALASRVASRAKIIALTQGSSTRRMSEALHNADYGAFNRLLHQSGAEYLILSTLGPKESQYELTSYVFSRNNGRPQKVSRLLSSLADPLPAVDELALDLSTALNTKGDNSESKASGQKSGAAAFATRHPELAYREQMLTNSAAGLEAGGRFELVESSRSRAVELELMDMNAGDIDGDGVNEILLLGASELLVYRYEDGRFQKRMSLALPSHVRYLALSLGDCNRNGLAEIYISASNGDKAVSSVWEWRGQQLVRIMEQAPYYLYAQGLPGKAARLLAQSPPPGEASGGHIFLMRFTDQNTLSPESKLELPEDLNLYDIALADLNGDGVDEIVAINGRDQLQVFDGAGNRLWSGPAGYGASSNFYGTLSALAGTYKEPRYLHTRIVTQDIDLDGVTDVLVGKNRAETVRFMPNLRYFDGSSIAALKWEGAGLKQLWETKTIPGYVVNYQLLHADSGPGVRLHLIFAEKESAYPFQFWAGSTAFLHSLQLAAHP